MNRQGVNQANRPPGGIGQAPPIRANTNAIPPNSRLQQTSRVPSNSNQWPFQGAAPGLSSTPGRNPGMMTSFAQTIGGNQPSTPLDPSEFPSLSGGSSIQPQNHNQAIWSGQRQHTPVQQQQRAQPPQIGSNQQPQEHPQQALDDAFFGSNTTNNMDEFRRAQNGVGQITSSNPQPGSRDEFPPLGQSSTGEIGGDRRINMLQSVGSGFGSNNGGAAFPPGIGPPRSGQEGIRNPARPLPTGGDTSLFSSMNETSQLPIGSGQPQTQTSTIPPVLNEITNLDSNSISKPNGSTQRTMTDEEKYGLPGLLDAIKNENNDNFNLAIGHDLTTLGLDLNSTEPFYPTFGGPLATRNARAMTPDFNLPQCYTVTNVPPIAEKLPNFSDDTLFYIFYMYCGDVLQESAAIELTYRSWRWHKTGRFWMTKDANFAEPMSIDHESERGRYIVFDEKTWAKKPMDLTLHYADLDDHISNAPPNSLPGPMGFP